MSFVKFKTAKEANLAINHALAVAFKYSQIDGDHHKTWSIDQMVRCLCNPTYDPDDRDDDNNGSSDKYTDFIEEYKDGDNYNWDEGCPP